MSGGFSGSGIGSGDVNWRIDQLVADMNIMWSKIADLENGRDEKSEPYDVMDSFRSSKIERDAGEPANRYFVDCLKENAKLIEENDVLRYQYETMHKETVGCKSQLEQLQKALADKQKVLEDVMDQRDRYLKQIYTHHDANWYEEQAIRKCIDIVEKNKAELSFPLKIPNDPLTRGECKRWMVAICEDIQQEIKKELGVK